MRLHKVSPGARRNLALMALGALILAGAYAALEWGAEESLLRADPDRLEADAGVTRFALARGASVYRARCASCHGADGEGDPAQGVPNLADKDWLYGQGAVSDIERVVDYGIRSHNPKSWNLAVMPALATPHPDGEKGLAPLSPGDIEDVVDFLWAVEGRPHNAVAAARGGAIYATRGACYDCHGADARGDAAIGAPNLADRIWLYGDGGRKAVFQSIAQGRQGVCPAWIKVLKPAQIREVAVFTHALSHAVRSANDLAPHGS